MLPTFREIAEQRIADSGPRDKTINIKVAINTARMMVKAENLSRDDLLGSLEWIATRLERGGTSAASDAISQARAAIDNFKAN